MAVPKTNRPSSRSARPVVAVPTRILYDRVETPIGQLLIVAANNRLRYVSFEDQQPFSLDSLAGQGVVEPEADPFGFSSRLKAYFDGDVMACNSILVDIHGTPFQMQVWHAVMAIQPGTVVSYAEIARRLGAPNATRAVGAANGANPVPVVIPCHRVIGTDGKLTGYGGGMERKRWLLVHEGYLLT